MKVLKIILHSRLLLIILLIITLIYTTIFNITSVSYKKGEQTLTGKVIKKRFTDDHLTFTLKNNKTLPLTYYIKNKKELKEYKKITLGSIIRVTGTLKSNNYLIVKNIKILKENRNIIYFIKDGLYNYLSSFDSRVSPYLKAFIIGNKDDLSYKVKKSLQTVGISHLFSLSGSHLAIIYYFLYSLFKKRKIHLMILPLFLYYLIIDSSASILRALVFLSIFKPNKEFHLGLSTFNMLILALIVLLIINPASIKDIGFNYSFVISSGLILYYDNKKQDKKLFRLVETSILAFLFSLPISLYYFSNVNLLSIIYNLFYVPFVSSILFPLTFIVAICPFLSDIYLVVVNLFEKSIFFFEGISINLTFRKLSIIIYIIYLLIIFIAIYKRKVLYLLLILLVPHYFYNNIVVEDKMYMIDVGQGDSILFVSNNKSMLLDTGGSINSSLDKWSVGDDLVTFLRSKGIRRIDTILISHGDMDHIGEYFKIVKYFKVDNVYLNSNRLNSIEKRVVTYSLNNNINITKLKNGDNISLGNFNFLVINSSFTDENDASTVLFGMISSSKLLLMGDASVRSEQDIINSYNLPKIDILKVGHHGSNTSSSKKFINEINPKYSLISVGENNRYGHPKKSVLNTLSNSEIYRTDLDGNIEIEFNNKGYNIRAYSP